MSGYDYPFTVYETKERKSRAESGRAPRLPPHGEVRMSSRRGAVDREDLQGFFDAAKYLRNLGSQQKKLVRYGVLEKGKSLYLPYAWCHAVLFLCDEERVCCMYYAEMQTRVSLVASAWKRCQRHCRVNKRIGPDDSESHDSE